jgi:hypothetical protein
MKMLALPLHALVGHDICIAHNFLNSENKGCLEVLIPTYFLSWTFDSFFLGKHLWTLSFNDRNNATWRHPTYGYLLVLVILHDSLLMYCLYSTLDTLYKVWITNISRATSRAVLTPHVHFQNKACQDSEW